MPIPSNFAALATNAIDQYVRDFGEDEGLDADDLIIRPATNGNGWSIVHRIGQLPVENSGRANVTLRPLHQLDQARKDTEKQTVIDRQEKMQKDRAAGIGPLGRVIPPVKGGLFTGHVHDAILMRDAEDQQASGAVPAPEKAEPGRYWFETVVPPVRGELFSGAAYEQQNKPDAATD